MAVLSGPTFAREVALGRPTAAWSPRPTRRWRAGCSDLGSREFRLYTNADVVGVEVGGALKNVIAIATGLADGLGLGENARAALITRGLAEITRLAVALGAAPATLAGLAGLGDLVLTCTGSLSRNRALGMALAQGGSRPSPGRDAHGRRGGAHRGLGAGAGPGVTASGCRSARRSAPCSSRQAAARGARRAARAGGHARGRAAEPREDPMPELRKDPVVGRWVIIATERARRPSTSRRRPAAARGACPFCARPRGADAARDPRRPRPSASADAPGLAYRVVPNKFPALRIEGDLEPAGEGIYDRMNGVGAHEVIIETPDHQASLATMSVDNIPDVLWAYRERLVDLKKDPRFAYVMVFKNHGEAAGRVAGAPALAAHRHAHHADQGLEEMTGSADYY